MSLIFTNHAMIISFIFSIVCIIKIYGTCFDNNRRKLVILLAILNPAITIAILIISKGAT